MEIELGLSDQKKAIELLYSQYVNPIQTCVQELVSNAFDAHRDANKNDVPVKITIPNELNEFYFSVRDFGNSMDVDTIKNVYMRVNASTKSNSNKSIGGFGIGSKTPWAYTDTFILKTFLDGLETQYALVKGRSSVAVVYSGKTDEPNGVEVVFQTKPNDKTAFFQAVRRISLAAKVKPIVNTKIPLHFNSVDIINSNVSFAKDDLLESNEVYLNIGGVLYKLDPDFLGYTEDASSWYSRKKANLDYVDIIGFTKDSSVLINLPVGSIMPLQTREGLFTGGNEGIQNKAILKKVLRFTLSSISKELQERELTVTNISEAIKFFGKGLIQSKNNFKFGGVEVDSRGLTLENGRFSTITRESKRYSRNKLTKGRKEVDDSAKYAELKHVYFSDLSANKARLVSRFHNLSYHADVLVIEKDYITEGYEELKKTLNAIDIETVDIPKNVSSAKGATRDKSKVVWYDSRNERQGEFNINKDYSNKKIVIIEKDRYPKYGRHCLIALGYTISYVAPTNMEKLTCLDGFYTEEEALEFDKLRDLYINSRYNKAKESIKLRNVKEILKYASPNKQSLFSEVESKLVFDRYTNNQLVEELEKRYDKGIDRDIKTMLKKRARVKVLVEKAPLVQHIDEIWQLKGQAKRDLETYIKTSLQA
jgi:anti-sigma regulatory factor (Ser/Thr protein kinase)